MKALERLVRKYRVDQVQTRSLCIDPLQYLEVARTVARADEPMGIAGRCGAAGRSALAPGGKLRPGTRRTGKPAGSPRNRLSRAPGGAPS